MNVKKYIKNRKDTNIDLEYIGLEYLIRNYISIENKWVFIRYSVKN